MTRLFGFLSVLAVLAASGYAFLGPERLGGLNPIGKVSEAEAGAEFASAKYTLAIVAGQLAQVHVVTDTYAGHARLRQLVCPAGSCRRKLVLPRVQEDTADVLPRRPGRHRRPGHLLITRSS